jgi:hypothetical protein
VQISLPNDGRCRCLHDLTPPKNRLCSTKPAAATDSQHSSHPQPVLHFCELPCARNPFAEHGYLINLLEIIDKNIFLKN